MRRLAAPMAPALAWLGARWVARQRARHRAGGGHLPAEARSTLARYFPAETLDAARLAVVPRIDPPRLLSMARRLGLAAVDFERVLGITFGDTIVLVERVTQGALLPTLFHELVHVEQARRLGARAFVRRYVREWIEAGRYGAIPLERDAYALQRRYEEAPGEPFDVAAEVARRLYTGGP
jgi:hypothetical protein